MVKPSTLGAGRKARPVLVVPFPDAFMPRACEIPSSCGHCAAGRHDSCAHGHGRAFPTGAWLPEGWITDRRGYVLSNAETGPNHTHVQLLPLHVWRCQCAVDNHWGPTIDPKTCPSANPKHYGKRCACVPGQMEMF